MGRIPVGERPANGVFHRPKDKQLVIIQIILCMNDRRAVTGIVVRHDDLFSSPARIVSTVREQTFFIGLNRLSTIFIHVPAIKRITFTLRGHVRHRNFLMPDLRIVCGNGLIRIDTVHVRRVSFPHAAVCIEPNVLCNPHGIERVRIARVLHGKYTGICIRFGCPAAKPVTIPHRVFRLTELDLQLQRRIVRTRTAAAATRDVDYTLIGPLAGQRARRPAAVEIRIPKYSVKMAFITRANTGARRSIAGNRPLTVQNSQFTMLQNVIIRIRGRNIRDFLTAGCRCVNTLEGCIHICPIRRLNRNLCNTLYKRCSVNSRLHMDCFANLMRSAAYLGFCRNLILILIRMSSYTRQIEVQQQMSRFTGFRVAICHRSAAVLIQRTFRMCASILASILAVLVCTTVCHTGIKPIFVRIAAVRLIDCKGRVRRQTGNLDGLAMLERELIKDNGRAIISICQL